MKGKQIKKGSYISFTNDRAVHNSRYIHPKGVVFCEDNRKYNFIYMEAIVNGRIYTHQTDDNNFPTAREKAHLCRKFLLSIAGE